MQNRTGWRYAAVGLFIASIAAVISYRDGLFVARLAGNHDDQAYLYPFLPDGLIVACLLALYEASRAGVRRSRWAMGGLVLGITLTLAQNVYAGLAHSVLDAVLDGMVPVVFFITVEVVLWHARRVKAASAGESQTGRGSPQLSPAAPAASPVPVRVPIPRVREIRERRGCSQATAEKARAEVRLFASKLAPYSPAGDSPPAPAGVNGNGAHG